MKFLPLWALTALLAFPAFLPAQTASAISGAVTAAAGAPAAGATVTVHSAGSGSSIQTRTDAAGRYSVPNLAPGDYDLTVAAAGFPAKTVRVTLGAEARVVDVALGTSPGELSVGDLGFTPEQTAGNAALQKRLDRRSHMLKTHQRLGLITAAPLIATLISSNGAKEDKHNATPATSSSGRQLHAALGSITAGMYLTTASFAIFAPKAPAGTKVRGPIRLHKALAWIHGPGMILTPILGAMAYQQLGRGERVHGIAKAHAPAAMITTIAYGLAIASVSIKF